MSEHCRGHIAFGPSSTLVARSLHGSGNSLHAAHLHRPQELLLSFQCSKLPLRSNGVGGGQMQEHLIFNAKRLEKNILCNLVNQGGAKTLAGKTCCEVVTRSVSALISSGCVVWRCAGGPSPVGDGSEFGVLTRFLMIPHLQKAWPCHPHHVMSCLVLEVHKWRKGAVCTCGVE